MCNIVPSLYVRPTCLRSTRTKMMCQCVQYVLLAFAGLVPGLLWHAIKCALFVLKIAAWIFYKVYKFVFYNRLVDHRKCEMKPKKKSPCKEAESTKCAKKSKKENSSFYLIFKY